MSEDKEGFEVGDRVKIVDVGTFVPSGTQVGHKGTVSKVEEINGNKYMDIEYDEPWPVFIYKGTEHITNGISLHETSWNVVERL